MITAGALQSWDRIDSRKTKHLTFGALASRRCFLFGERDLPQISQITTHPIESFANHVWLKGVRWTRRSQI